MRHLVLTTIVLLALATGAFAQAQDDDSSSSTMRPVIRGRRRRSSMKPEATEAARGFSSRRQRVRCAVAGRRRWPLPTSQERCGSDA